MFDLVWSNWIWEGNPKHEIGWDSMDVFGCADAGTQISRDKSANQSAGDFVMDHSSEGSFGRHASSDASIAS